jgi:hypothetical protein
MPDGRLRTITSIIFTLLGRLILVTRCLTGLLLDFDVSRLSRHDARWVIRSVDRRDKATALVIRAAFRRTTSASQVMEG